jgi:CheY-like chemotaxis protein
MDDDLVIQIVFYEMLKLLGFDAVCVNEGIEAITVYGNACMKVDTFVVVILDLHNRTGIGGEDTLAKLREINPQVKAIICSSDRGHPVMQHYRKHGFVRALAKPFSIEELQDVLLG